jgi:hypothetical protein
MSKRSATSQPEGNITSKRICTGVVRDDFKMLIQRIKIVDDETNPFSLFYLINFEENGCEFIGINDEITDLQARIRGAMTRNRVVPAMLSADPTDLRQAVQFCANGYK